MYLYGNSCRIFKRDTFFVAIFLLLSGYYGFQKEIVTQGLSVEKGFLQERFYWNGLQSWELTNEKDARSGIKVLSVIPKET